MTIEQPRNVFWTRTPEGVQLVKMVGDPGSSSHRVLFECFINTDDLSDIVYEMTYNISEPEPEDSVDSGNADGTT